MRALDVSMAQIDFAEVLLFTDREPSTLGLGPTSPIRVIPIAKIQSSEAYSRFMLERLADHIKTSHCLVVQWDGHVIDAQRWQNEFLEYDYIGASWPQFDDGHDVGNGGFSLRSRRLMETCQSAEFDVHHPEDVAICRTNRHLLEDRGLSFAPLALADQFSSERASDPGVTFGYHGAFIMPRVLGMDRFWTIYRQLTDRTTVWNDFGLIWRTAINERRGIRRSLAMVVHRARDAMRR